MMQPEYRLERGSIVQRLVFIGLTAALIGYFVVWLPGPAAGLRLIGVEIGEWIKFLGVGTRRNLFYIPPVALGLILALLTSDWPNGRWQTWFARLLAILISLLAFPAVASITLEPSSEWVVRLAMIALVGLAGLASSIASSRTGTSRVIWAAIGLVAVVGLVGPTWQYFAVRPVVEEILRHRVGIGLGLWLNTIGFAMIVLATLLALRPPAARSVE